MSSWEVRSTGDNLDLQLVSDVGARGWSCGMEPLTCGI